MSDSTRWGDVGWGEAVLGESATGSTHILEAHAGAALRADAERLGIRHPINATVRVRSQAYGAGAGPAPIHPLRGAVTVSGADATATTLSFRHHLEAAVALTFSVAPTNLTMGHKLAAGSISTLDVTAKLGIRHWLTAAMTGALVASATDLDRSHPLAATIIAQLGAMGRHALTMPVLPSLADLDLADPTTFIAGSINLSPNPSVENDVIGWLAEDGATVERALGPARDGLWSASFSRNGGGGANAALVARSIEGLGIPPVDGSLAWGQAWLAAPAPIDVIVKARARYDDGTVDEGEASEPITITATGLLGAWDRVLAPALPLDGLDETRVLLSIELVMTPAELGDAAWYADTAIIEYDPWMVLADGFVPSGLPVGPQEGEEEELPPGEGA